MRSHDTNPEPRASLASVLGVLLLSGTMVTRVENASPASAMSLRALAAVAGSTDGLVIKPRVLLPLAYVGHPRVVEIAVVHTSMQNSNVVCIRVTCCV